MKVRLHQNTAGNIRLCLPSYLYFNERLEGCLVRTSLYVSALVSCELVNIHAMLTFLVIKQHSTLIAASRGTETNRWGGVEFSMYTT
jgi:hypothetical protein